MPLRRLLPSTRAPLVWPDISEPQPMHAIMLTNLRSSDHFTAHKYFSRTSKNAAVYPSSTWFVFHNPDFRIVSCGERKPSQRSEGRSIGSFPKLLSRAMQLRYKYARSLAL